MSWIEIVDYENAGPQLKRIYDRVKGPDNNVDNVLSIHSLRPHSLVGHMTLYKNVLHNSNNELPKWYLEAIGIYVSHLNKCDYCVQHHFEGFKRLLNDDQKAERFIKSVKTDELNGIFEDKFLVGMEYAKKLTIAHTEISKKEIDDLRASGFTDGQILEINQVTSYFNYVNRTVLGLGVNTKGDILGLSPNESADPNNWNHK
ncbi:carboxymuconolactone decarboxylase family protein [Flagellimonas onchidii]|uniref:carboxymuconolactone decarboxylase family protein n=1 Tax=Flagellimonas onchidii TaxID=2562684 RepID=UPI0010A65B60|nr:peroxidase-related enzyme [Allomuricauda onchidii]